MKNIIDNNYSWNINLSKKINLDNKIEQNLNITRIVCCLSK